jgi:hypothetical protein
MPLDRIPEFLLIAMLILLNWWQDWRYAKLKKAYDKLPKIYLGGESVFVKTPKKTVEGLLDAKQNKP